MKGDELPLAFVLLAFNEEGNVPIVVPELLAWLRSRGSAFELLVIDDGSTDKTAAIAEELLKDEPRAKVLRHGRNRGMGAGIKTGYRASTMPWVTFGPADGQIPISAYQALTRTAVEQDARVVYSVYRKRDDGLHRTILSAGVRGLIYAVHRVWMPCDGPYLFRRELFEPEKLVPDTFFLNFEFPIRMERSHERTAQVEVECHPRISGSSKSTGLRRIAGVARDLLSLRVRLWTEKDH